MLRPLSVKCSSDYLRGVRHSLTLSPVEPLHRFEEKGPTAFKYLKVPVEVNDETDVDPVAVRVSSNPDEARHDAEPVKA